MMDLKGYEGVYAVTEDGRVWSQPKMHGRSPRQGFWMKQSIERTGYRFVFLQHKGTRHIGYVHRLVAETYLPGTPGRSQVNHKDGNKAHNHVVNLEWLTPSENIKHAFATGLSSQLGSRNAKAKLDEQKVRMIRAAVEAGSTQREVARLCGVTPSIICRVISGKGWAHA